MRSIQFWTSLCKGLLLVTLLLQSIINFSSTYPAVFQASNVEEVFTSMNQYYFLYHVYDSNVASDLNFFKSVGSTHILHLEILNFKKFNFAPISLRNGRRYITQPQSTQKIVNFLFIRYTHTSVKLSSLTILKERIILV